LRERLHHTVLKGEHLTVVGLVVVAGQMENAVDHGLDQVLRVLRADDDVAQLARAGDGLVLVDREREDVGGLVLPAMLAVQLLDAGLVDELDREVAVADARRCERRLGRAPEARVGCLDLDQRDARRRRSDV
jgi:hypothetical protein